MGNKKQFCAANMEKIDNRERCVRLSPLMSEHRHQSRTHRKYSAADGTHGFSLFSSAPTHFLSWNSLCSTWIWASEVQMVGGCVWPWGADGLASVCMCVCVGEVHTYTPAPHRPPKGNTTDPARGLRGWWSEWFCDVLSDRAEGWMQSLCRDVFVQLFVGACTDQRAGGSCGFTEKCLFSSWMCMAPPGSLSVWQGMVVVTLRLDDELKPPLKM